MSSITLWKWRKKKRKKVAKVAFAFFQGMSECKSCGNIWEHPDDGQNWLSDCHISACLFKAWQDKGFPSAIASINKSRCVHFPLSLLSFPFGACIVNNNCIFFLLLLLIRGQHWVALRRPVSEWRDVKLKISSIFSLFLLVLLSSEDWEHKSSPHWVDDWVNNNRVWTFKTNGLMLWKQMPGLNSSESVWTVWKLGLPSPDLMLIRSSTKHASPHSEPDCSAFLPRSNDRFFLLGLLLLQHKKEKDAASFIVLYSLPPLFALHQWLLYREFAPSHLLCPVLMFWIFFLMIPHFENTIHTTMAQHNTWQICTVSHLSRWISWPSAPFAHTPTLCVSVCVCVAFVWRWVNSVCCQQ